MISADMTSLYKTHLALRTEQLRQVMATNGINQLLIGSGDLVYRFRDDTSYPYRANPYAARLLPMGDYPSSFIVIDSAHDKPTLALYQPKDYWHAAHAFNCDIVSNAFKVQIFEDRDALATALPKGNQCAYLGPGAAPGDQAIASTEMIQAIDWQQAVKTEYEIECMARANQRAACGHVQVAQLFQNHASEFDLHLAYLAATSATEAELPYDNIIACNQNAAVLHYTQCLRNPGPHNSLLIDAGATYQGYAADISRSYATDQGLYQDLITALDNLQQQLVAAVRPGIAYLELHQLAHRLIGQLLIESEIIRTTLENTLQQQLVSIFFPHGLGHLLGVQVHDAGGWLADKGKGQTPPPSEHPFLRLTRTLEENMVFTVEPGIYFIDLLLREAADKGHSQWLNLPLIESLKPYGGIRIEDNICVTKDGASNLTRNAFAGKV